MANIQQGINQLLTTAALGTGLFMHSDAGKAITATKQAKQSEALAGRIKETLATPGAITGSPAEQDAKRDELRAQYEEAAERGVSGRKEAATLSPTQKRESAYIQSAAKRKMEIGVGEYRNFQNEMYDREQAMEHMRLNGTNQVQQKQDYKDFLESIKNQPTSLGGKVKDLPEALQQKIAKIYKEGNK